MKPDITLEAFAWKVAREAMDHVEECNKRIEEIAKERDGLWAQVATLREALSAISENVDENLTESFGPFAEDRDANDSQGVAVLERARTALAATPSESLAEYRKRVRSEVRDELLSKLLPSAWSDDTGYEMAVNMVRRMAGRE